MTGLRIKKRASAWAYVLILGIYFIAAANVEAASSTYDVPRMVRYGFTLQNTTSRLLERADFWVYAPLAKTSTQLCESLVATHPYELIEDKLGNRILHFTFRNLPPHGHKVITIKARLLMSDTANVLPDEDMDRFLRPEPFIESDALEILRLAGRLRGKTDEATLRNTFKWVSRNLRYAGYMKNERGALYALTNKRGDCTEYAYLFTALSRANGVPARAVAGYAIVGDGILKAEDFHDWAEVRFEDSWAPVDPQKKAYMTDSTKYIAMRIIGDSPGSPMGSAHRFRSEGRGLAIKMN